MRTIPSQFPLLVHAGNSSPSPGVALRASPVHAASLDIYAAAVERLRLSGFAAEVRTLRLSMAASDGVVAAYVQPGDSRLEWVASPAGPVPSRHLFRLEGRREGSVTLFSGAAEGDVAMFVASLTSPLGHQLLASRRPAQEWDPHQAELASESIDLNAYLAIVEVFNQAGL
ncbi:hypothetical protein ABIC83_002591 [Roseateles asaccharophilus]|uniref:hypothetical protein n=1 Tax=Roseateles asaccharophilus TaxID=582607 RepID=UPI0038388736